MVKRVAYYLYVTKTKLIVASMMIFINTELLEVLEMLEKVFQNDRICYIDYSLCTRKQKG